MSPAGGARYAKPFTPLSVAGLQAWYDAADTSTITSSSGAVSQWNDKSGNGRNLTQGSGTLQPITGTRSRNGLNVVDFDGTNDSMDSSSFAIAQPGMLFAVALSDVGSDATSQRIVDAVTAPFSMGKGATNFWLYSAGTTRGVGTPDTAAHAHSVLFNGAGSSRWVDGTLSDTNNAGANGLAGGIRLGRVAAASANFWNGWIAEVIAYSGALSTVDRQRVDSYLRVKWATP